MKTALLFKALSDGPADIEIPSTLVAHAKRNRTEALGNRDHQTLKTLFAIQEAV